VRDAIFKLQQHITVYEKTIGSNPKIYKLETAFLKLLGIEELAMKDLSPSLEKDISEHWNIARRLLIQYRKNPYESIRSGLTGDLDSMEENHTKSVATIDDHSEKLRGLKEMIEKIDAEIVTSLKEYDLMWDK
jgi:hypothetical protein